MVFSLLINAVYAAKKNVPFEVRADVSYGQVEGEKLLLDLYLPKDGELSSRPAVVSRCSKVMGDFLCGQ